jgi:hypothetical protein
MQPEPIPTDLFVGQVMSEKLVRDITDGWRIEPDQLHNILSRHLREMGIFFVLPTHARMLRDSLVHHLRHSVEIKQILRKAELEEQTRKKVRLSD